MYAMDMRQYDPAIGRWVVQDPVVHHDMSPYNAFDNNPVFWADPSGADAVYNWDGPNKGKYTDGDKEVSFEQAFASHGLNADGREKSNEDGVSSMGMDIESIQQGGEVKPAPDTKGMDSKYDVKDKKWKNVGGRQTIVNSKGEILQWDSKKGEVEVYRNKQHLGGFDPNDRERQISRPVKNRVPNGGWKTHSHKFFNVISKIVQLPLFIPHALEQQIYPYGNPYGDGKVY